jgi:ribosomal-protein-alanine N-acetyltransferase
MTIEAVSGHDQTPVTLRPVPAEAVDAINAGRRMADWADDFPDTGDRVIARLLSERGEVDGWPHCQVLERATGVVVGGAGFKGAPRGGEVEIGYNIVPSRQRRGYATAAVGLLLAYAWDHGADAVTACTDPGNRASQRVLEKAGFALVTVTDQQRLYRTPPER